MNNIWQMDLDSYIKIMEEAIELAKSRGKQKGDNIEQEFFEVVKKNKLEDKLKHLGTTDKDGDLLTGDLREEGLKILNLNELERKNEIP